MANNVDINAQMYDDLVRQYDLTADRRKTLTSQASSLLGFTGIIETILIATVVALGSDADFRSVIIGSNYHSPILYLAGIGFVAYSVTVFFSLLGMIEPKWMPAPQFPVKRGYDLAGSVKEYWTKGTGVYDRMDAAVQLASGLEYDQKVNDKKFGFIRIASASLVGGIIASAIAGFFFLLSALGI